jgi:hypothetical protein
MLAPNGRCFTSNIKQYNNDRIHLYKNYNEKYTGINQMLVLPAIWQKFMGFIACRQALRTQYEACAILQQHNKNAKDCEQPFTHIYKVDFV